MAVFGVDLGTTYSCISYVDSSGRPVVLRNLEGSDTTPSAVYFESPEDVVVGAAAKDTAVLEPDLVIELIKREMGRHLTLKMHGRTYTPEEISAFLLRKLAADAEAATGEQVTDLVVTVPAYFGIAERDATRKAGDIAGLNVIDVLSEPIAAAISYGVLAPDADRTILVYDLGGGTFDTTVISMREGDIQVVCTDGDHELGGVDWDERLAEYVVEAFVEQHPDTSHPLDDPATVQDIRAQVEEAKKRLSTARQRTLRVVHEGRVAAVTLTRQQFEEMTSDLLDRTVDITRRALDVARKRGVRRLDEVVLVGGSAKMPAVVERLRKELGGVLKAAPKLHDPDLSVAKGAALYAFEETYRRLLSAGSDGKERAERMARWAGLSASQEQAMAKRQIRTVASRGFGVLCYSAETGSEHVVHLIHSNDALPVDATRTFYTVYDDQGEVGVQVMEQAGSVESEAPGDNKMIASGPIGVPPGKPAGWPIDVTFHLDASGLLHVAAAEQSGERQPGERSRLDLEIQVGGMSSEDVARSRASLSHVRVN
ncbi:MAG: Hsp70 family protein [Micromonosporaceae bacterium]|nr:Hsp70 family protein [Micromonosporaceae bacterium]